MLSPPASDRRFLAALTLALAAHALLLFAIRLPELQAAARQRVNVTLSVAPSRDTRPSEVGAAAAQTGPDAESQRRRAPRPDTAAVTSGAAPTPAREAAPGAVARAEPSAPRTAAEPTPPPSPAQAPPETGEAAVARVRSAEADPRAAYLAAWKRQVERAGSRDFPSHALGSGGGNRLTLSVTMAADGRLASARVLRSSGNAALDAAALRIVTEAGPFAAFPPALRRERAELTFAYDWRFVAGGDAPLSVQ